jgi:hypothetical protein
VGKGRLVSFVHCKQLKYFLDFDPLYSGAKHFFTPVTTNETVCRHGKYPLGVKLSLVVNHGGKRIILDYIK